MLWRSAAVAGLAGAVGPALPATAVIAAVAADEGGYAVKLSDDCPLDGRFEIGSMTKTMTGTVLASLVNDRTVEFRDPAAEPIAADDRVISRTAADAATLLQNSGHALPLTPAALSSLALIGPGADQVIGTGPSDGSGAGTAQPPGTLQVLRQDLVSDPAAHLSFAVGDDMTGTPVPASVLTHEGQPGLVRSSAGHDAARVVSVLDNTVAGYDALPAGSGHTWAGELTVPATGTYSIGLGTGGSWGALTLDGTVVAQDGPGQPRRAARRCRPPMAWRTCAPGSP